MQQDETPSKITLGDVLSQTYLGLRLVVGTNEDLKRPVSGAHAIEVANPSRWISSNWIALTTGLRLRSRPQAQRDLILELKEIGITALGFGLGVNFSAIPKALLEEAAAQSFPVFSVPYTTGFAEVIAFVNQSLASPHLNTLLRFVSMQDYLLSSLSEPSPLDAICNRMSQLLGVEVLILGSNYQVLASDFRHQEEGRHKTISNAVREQLGQEMPHLQDTDAIHRQDRNNARGRSYRAKASNSSDKESSTERGTYEPSAADYVSAVVDFRAEAITGTAISVGTRQGILGWLVTTDTDQATTSAHLRLPLLRSTAHLVAATLQQKADLANALDAKRRTVMREIVMGNASQHTYLSKDQPSDPTMRRQVLEGLFSLGLEPSNGGCVLYLEFSNPSTSHSVTPSTLTAATGELSSYLSCPYLIDIFHSGIAIYVQVERTEVEELVRSFDALGNYRIGVSSYGTGLRNLPAMLREAIYCTLRLDDSGQARHRSNFSHRVRFFDDLSLADFIESYVPANEIRGKRRQWITPILDQPALLSTLKALLRHNLDINLASKDLGIHPNSLRYRVQKAETDLGISLKDLNDTVDLYLALRDL